MRGDTSSSAWIRIKHNGTKYMIPKHAFEAGISGIEYYIAIIIVKGNFQKISGIDVFQFYLYE